MTPRDELIERLELIQPEFADEILEALTAAGYAVVAKEKIRVAMGFFESCIRSGEPWTPQCEEIKQGLIAAAKDQP